MLHFWDKSSFLLRLLSKGLFNLLTLRGVISQLEFAVPIVLTLKEDYNSVVLTVEKVFFFLPLTLLNAYNPQTNNGTKLKSQKKHTTIGLLAREREASAHVVFQTEALFRWHIFYTWVSNASF